ncbi:MAG: metal-dependent transcriptional regulator [Thermoplasmata archaeon]
METTLRVGPRRTKNVFQALDIEEEFISANLENYLLAIWVTSAEKKIARTSDIAVWLKVAPSSVTEMLQKLADEGYVIYTPYKGVRFTAKGYAMAVRVVRRHCIAERFLTDLVGVPVEEVHEQAHKLEHAFTDEVEQEICRMLNRPIDCPDDAIPIPKCFKPMTCEACIEEGDLLLTGVPKGATASVSHMTSEDEGKVRRLIAMGFKPGVDVTVVDVVEGVLLVGVEERRVALSIGDASMVHVIMDQRPASMLPVL